jgi:hypothetical protein
MKPNPKKIARVAAATGDSRFAKSPELAALHKKMATELERKERRTPWATPAIRAEMLRRYADVLDSPTEAALKDFVRWAVEDARYLAAEGNFQMFAYVYLAADIDETPTLWGWAEDGGN